MERAEREGQVLRRRSMAVHGGHTPEKTWRQRLAQLRSYPSKKAAAHFEDRVVEPALQEVVNEFNTLGYDAELTSAPPAETDSGEHTLVVNMEDHRNFHYQVSAVEAPAPIFGGRSMSRQIDIDYRLEVCTQTGTEGYDLVGLTADDVEPKKEEEYRDEGS